MTAEALSDPSDIQPGTRLGRYEVLLPIAQGGMARVWAAKQHGQRGFTKTVAIKTILPNLANDDSFERMFLDEARLAATVHHPNVCEIFDLGEEAQILYIAMEWVNGESLARIVKPPRADGGKGEARKLDPRVAARIVADAAAGLHAAHELRDEQGELLNVVHRDVSPQNILVSLAGTVKVTDFGVAKALSNTQESTMAGQIKGKVSYMSPEQARGGKVDRRSDIFALGIVLYEITTGHRPFAAENQLETLKRVGSGEFAPPSSVAQGYPRELETIVKRAMTMDPVGRYPSADRMRVALEEWLARSGPIVTETQVAAAVRERLGPLIEGRQKLIRSRMKAPTSTSVPPPLTFATPAPTDGSSSKISSPSSSAVRSVGESSPDALAASDPSVPSQTSDPHLSSAPSMPSVSPRASAPEIHRPPMSSGSFSNPGMPMPAVPPAPVMRPSLPSQSSEPSHSGFAAGSGSIPDTAPPVAPAPARPNTAARTALIGVAAGLAAFLIAGIALLVAARPAEQPDATAEAVPPPAAAPPAPTTTQSPQPVAEPAKKPAPGESLSETVRVRAMEPGEGITFLENGRVLSPAELTFARPGPGEVKLITARAAGYHDELLRIDESSSEIVDVLLAKLDQPKPVDTGAREPANERKPDKKPTPVKPDIPDNPF